MKCKDIDESVNVRNSKLKSVLRPNIIIPSSVPNSWFDVIFSKKEMNKTDCQLEIFKILE